MADLKGAVNFLLCSGLKEGMGNSALGRYLGMYHGHVGHEGRILRVLLAMMQAEGVAEQDTVRKKWRLRRHEGATEAGR